MSINPLARGHVLVVPIAEIDHWIDAPDDLLAHMFEVVHRIGKAQKQAFDCERVGVIIAGYEVPHAHIHVIPTNHMSQLSFDNAAASVDRDEWRKRPRQSAMRSAERQSIGSMRSSPLLRTLLTSVDTVCMVSRVSGAGTSSCCSASRSLFDGSSHSCHAVGGSITGIRSCTGSIVALADVVMIVQLCSHGASGPAVGRATSSTARRPRAARRRGGG